MSEDIFKDLDDDCVADTRNGNGSIFGTPTEFSGVSGNAGSSHSNSPWSKPSSQSQTVPLQFPPPPPEPCIISTAEPISYFFIPPKTKCAVCKRLLKTKVGFEKHMQNHVDGGFVVPHTTATTTTTCAATTETIVTTASGSGTPVMSAPQDKETFYCSLCKKELQTKSGFTRHMASHRLNDLYRNKPSTGEFHSELKEVTMKITDEIIAEPVYSQEGEAKKQFMEEFKSKIGTPQWFDFVSPLSDFICDSILEKSTKLLPLNQYLEAQVDLFSHLFDNNMMMNLSDKLQNVCHLEIDSKILDRLVFRFPHKLIGRIQIWVTSKLIVRREDSAPQTNSNNFVMEERVKKAFLKNLGEIFRAFLKKGMLSELSQWQVTSACLLSKFVDCQQQPISTSNFLNKDHWFSGDENNIIPSKNAEDFFLAVENFVVCDSESQVDLDLVVGNILQNVNALNNWFHLTNDHFSEEKSLTLMKDLVRVYVRRSLLTREKLKNRQEEKSIRASTVGLRENLKTNFVEKGSDEPIVD